MKTIISWFLVSSANPEKISRTVLSLLAALGPFIIWYFQVTNEEWVQISSLVATIISTTLSLVFFVVKLVNTINTLKGDDDFII